MKLTKLVFEFFFILLFFFIQDVQSKNTFLKEGKRIYVEFALPKNISSIEIQLHSDRNKNVSKISDISPHNPLQQQLNLKNEEMYFPVFDIEIMHGIEMVAIFENVNKSNRYNFNGDFNPELKPFKDTLILKENIEHWENTIYIKPNNAYLKKVYFRKIIDVDKQNKFGIEFLSLSNQWSGTIDIIDRSGGHSELIERFEINEPISASVSDEKPKSEQRGIIQNLDNVVSYILNSQNTNPCSPTYGGLYCFYDLDSKTYRLPEWIWAYGPCIKILIEASKIPELSGKYGYEKLIETARQIGEVSLRFQINEKEHPAYGLPLCRFDSQLKYPDGFEGFRSPADSHFLMGYGWIPLYEATGDKRFLDAAELLAHQTWRILKLDDVIEQDYLQKAQKWKAWTLEESGFGMIGFKELYRINNDDVIKRIGKAYIESMLPIFQRDDGLWNRAYYRNTPNREGYGMKTNVPQGEVEVHPTNYMLRGQGWAMIGLLSSYELFKEKGEYLNYACKMADYIVSNQMSDDSWKRHLNRSLEEVNYTAKGTALWSMLLFQLYQKTANPKYLSAARKSLEWCNSHQYTGDDMDAWGGLVDRNSASGIIYRQWFDMITTYGVAFYGLALIEELNMQLIQK